MVVCDRTDSHRTSEEVPLIPDFPVGVTTTGADVV